MDAAGPGQLWATRWCSWPDAAGHPPGSGSWFHGPPERFCITRIIGPGELLERCENSVVAFQIGPPVHDGGDGTT